MKFRLLMPLGILSLVMSSCINNYRGELAPVERPGFKESKPIGMVLVPRGSYVMGSEADSTLWGSINQAQQVSIENFWMDQTEVTNKMYKCFVNAVMDSIYRTELGDEYLVRRSNGEFKKALTKEEIKEYYDKFYRTNPAFPMLKMLKSEYVIYSYKWYDELSASQNRNQIDVTRRFFNSDLKYQPKELYYEKDTCYLNETKSSVITRKIRVKVTSLEDYVVTRIINVYPDTTVWVNDFKNSASVDYSRSYFASSGYNNYPVVGVSWEQAQAFSNWRTNIYYTAGNFKKSGMIAPYRLPTEAEWEYAAIGQSEFAKYPWKNESKTEEKKKDKYAFYGNFKPSKGNFTEDGFLIMSPVAAFKPNMLGLYDLAGNVSEWTSTAYYEFGNTVEASMNPGMEYNALYSDPYIFKRKVVRGGSFKDSKDFISSRIRLFEYQNVPRAYIGFRNVRSKVGE